MSGTITHEWNGTVLTITSDSGTSSADLKGTKGDTGARGVRGLAGADGITSVNGKKGDITLTASDVGAEEAGTAESVRTQIEAWVEDGYLPLTGGTLTGSLTVNDNIYSKGTLVSQTNNFPQLTLQNNKAANLATLYVNTTTGDYSSVYLRVYSSASAYSTFNFGNDGKLSCGSLALATALPISSGGTGATTASGALTNLGALPLTGGTLTGNLGVNGIITAKTYLAVERNSNPQLALKNANSKPLAVLYAETSNGSYGNTHLQVYKSATESNTFTFANTGNFRAYGTICGSNVIAQKNEYPSFSLYNSAGNSIGYLSSISSTGAKEGVCIGVNSSNGGTKYFNFYPSGDMSVVDGTLTLGSPLTVTNGGTGSNSAAGARSNLGVEYAKYSTAETDTGNKWIDGKTIYRAVVYGTTSLSNSLGEVGTLPSAVETPVNIRAYAKGDDGAWRVIPNAYHGNSTWDAMIYINGNTIVMSFGSSWTKTRDFVVIVEYTK